ncbi:hypothetical protein HHK36_019684 [Tetracentron sinense]|uniref:Uncharacterized protein n=1 Tax=Tetracentron sinense TaxID=13715 RepID=A0A835D9D1_TETSI|nr:hypothetical protein HHK36_019684 [Tetracentron sinense]
MPDRQMSHLAEHASYDTFACGPALAHLDPGLAILVMKTTIYKINKDEKSRARDKPERIWFFYGLKFSSDEEDNIGNNKQMETFGGYKCLNSKHGGYKLRRRFVDSVLREYKLRRLIIVMAVKSGSLDYWRKYFRSANSNIFEVIEYAIIVAASDCPKEFKIMRDQIAERLFSCRLSNYLGFDHVKEEGDEGFESDFDGIGDDFVSKVNSSTDDHVEMKMNQVSNCSYDELEALTEEIEDESEIVGEVLRIEGILTNSQDESNGALFDSLRRLQLMALCVDILKWKNTIYSLAYCNSPSNETRREDIRRFC